MEKFLDDALFAIEQAYQNLGKEEYKVFLEKLFEEMEGIGDEE